MADRDPDLARSLSMGLEMLRGNRTEELEALAGELQERHPRSPPAAVLWARAAQKRGDWQAALVRWSECMRRFPDSVREPWVCGRARALAELGRYEEAEEVYGDAVRRFPLGHSGCAGLANVSLRRGDWPAAVDRWTLCLERFPGQVQPAWLTGLANALLEQGRFREAERTFGRAARLFPEIPGGYIGLARTADRRGALSASMRRWREVLVRFPGRQAARLSFARALFRAGCAREAEEHLDALLPDRSLRHRALPLLGRIAMNRRQWDVAVRRLRRLLHEGSDNPALLVEAGGMLGGMGLLEEGFRALERARDLAPADHAPWLKQIHLLFLADRLPERRAVGEQGVASLLRNGARFEAAALLDALGRFAEAQAVRSDPDPSPADDHKMADLARKQGRYDLYFQLLLRAPGLAHTPWGRSFARELAVTSTSGHMLRQALAAGRPVMRLGRLAERICSGADRTVPPKGRDAPLVIVGLSWSRGGAGRDLINIVEGLRSGGFRRPVHLLLSPKHEWPVSSRTVFDELVRSGVRVSHVDDTSERCGTALPGGPRDIVSALFREVRSPELREMMLYRDGLAELDPETVMIWGTGFQHLLPGLAALMTGAARIVYSLRGHGLLAEIVSDLQRVELARQVMAPLFRSPRVRVTACSSSVLERHMAEADWDGGNGTVIYPGITERRLKRSAWGHAHAGESASPDSDFCVGGVYRMSWEKRPLAWLRIAARTLAAAPGRRLLFLLVGDGPMAVAVREYAEHLGIASCCLFTGEVDDVSRWYERMDLLLHVPRSEGLGNVLVEAQWYGVPVVTTDVGGCPEAIAPGRSGWVEARRDPDAIVRRILWCMDSPEAMRRASQAGKQLARERFSAECSVARYLELVGSR